MGKAALLIVSAVIISSSYLMLSSQESTRESRIAQSDYEYTGMARDVAQSGVARALSDIKRKMMNAENEHEGTLKGGSFAAKVDGSSYGDLDVKVEGRSGVAEHEIDANVIFETPLDAALVLNVREETEIGFDGTPGQYTISGYDHRMRAKAPGKRGFVETQHGVRSNRANEYLGDVEAEGDGTGRSVTHEQGDFYNSFAGKDGYERLYQEAINESGLNLIDHASDLASGGPKVFGSEDDPAIVRVLVDTEVTVPVKGYGLLIIEDRNFKVEHPQFEWEGLILVRKDLRDDLTIEMKRGAKVHGSVVTYDVQPEAECAPNFEIDDNTGETIPKVDYRARIEVIGAAITNGQYGYDIPVTTQFEINNETTRPWGRYGTRYYYEGYDRSGDYGHVRVERDLGNVNDGRTRQWERSENQPAYPAYSSIRVDARSWLKAYYYDRYGRRQSRVEDGSGRKYWVPFMDRDSYDYGDLNLKVLRDGDDAPDDEGAWDQKAAKDFMKKYITPDNKMNLSKSQTIYLFELGSTNRKNESHDYQDLVVLVTLIPDDPDDCKGTARRLDFAVGGGTELRYSAEAIAKLGKRLDLIRKRTQVVVASQREAGAGLK